MSKIINYEICIAGKNECAINIVKFLLRTKYKKNLLILPNKNDKGKNGWQPSLKKFAIDNNLTIVNESKIKKIKNLIFFSIEYENIIKVNDFKSCKLYNIHFSLLPKYRGCHTNYLQLKFGEKLSGVTLHHIDSGIDTGMIIDQLKFPIKINDSGLINYLRLMRFAVIIFKKNFSNIIKNKLRLKKQNNKISSYYPRNYVNYKKEKFINFKRSSVKIHNTIRALIFPPLQLPIVNNEIICKSIYLNKKIKLKKL